MAILKGIQKTSLIDFQPYTSSVIFIGGCNFRCAYCHNFDLVLKHKEMPTLDEREICNFLEDRKNARKVPCKIDELYCLKCKKPKKAYDNKIALNPNGKNKVNVIAECITCRTKTHKSQGIENIAEILKYYQAV
jgi:pyruvate formate lyase activating enzyme